jgi:hypothetical protein
MSARKKTKRAPAKRGRNSAKSGVSAQKLKAVIEAQQAEIKRLLDKMVKQDEIDIPDLYNLQVMLNHLSQLTEMNISIMASMNEMIASMARNIKQ